MSSVVFTWDGKSFISNSEDNCLWLWDLHGTTIAKMNFGNEHQWALAVHPTLPLVATGGDKSLTIISLVSEWISYSIRENNVFFFSILDKVIKRFDKGSGYLVNINCSGLVSEFKDKTE